MIALVGSTGRVWRHLAAEALSMGHGVTVIARQGVACRSRQHAGDDAQGRSRISYGDFAASFIDELAAGRWLRQVVTAGY